MAQGRECKAVFNVLHVCSSARDAPRKIDPAATCGLPFSCLFGVKSTYHKIPQKDLVNHHFLSRIFNVCFSIFLGFRIRKISETISRSIRQWPDSRVVAMLHQRVGVPSAKGSRFHVFFLRMLSRFLPKILEVICQKHTTLSCGKSGGRQTVLQHAQTLEANRSSTQLGHSSVKNHRTPPFWGQNTMFFFFKYHEIIWNMKSTLKMGVLNDTIWYDMIWLCFYQCEASDMPVPRISPLRRPSMKQRTANFNQLSITNFNQLSITNFDPEKIPRPQGSLKFQPNKIAGQCEVFDHPGEVHRAPILGNPVPWLHFLDDSPALLNDVPESLCSFLDGDPPVTKRGNGKSSIYRWFLNSNLNF